MRQAVVKQHILPHGAAAFALQLKTLFAADEMQLNKFDGATMRLEFLMETVVYSTKHTQTHTHTHTHTYTRIK